MQHKLTFKVRAYEVDRYRHVNNAVYVNYLEHARYCFLEERGFVLDQVIEEGIGLVVRSLQIKYLAAAFVGDLLTIRTRATARNRYGGILEQKISRAEKNICVATVNYAAISLDSGRPLILPPHLDKMLEPV